MGKIRLKDLVIVTTNKNKLAEINAILGTNHKVSKIDILEIQSLSLDEVIKAKAKSAYERVKKPVMVADVSLEIEGLNGLPGTFIKFFIRTIGPEKTVRLFKNESKKAKVTDAIAIYNGNSLKIFKGTIYGTVIPKAKGSSGFGFDKVFIPEGFSQTYAQMSQELKNKISHRAKALRKVKVYLENVKK